jgi:hypothetical protein
MKMALMSALNQVEIRPKTAAFIFGEDTWVYEWFSTEVGCLTRGLRARGSDVPHGLAGELLVRGPNGFVGYWNDLDATSAALRDGWYHTGGMMRRGEGGRLWFVSRKKDLVARGGAKPSPVEVKRELAVQEAAVVGVPDAGLGQRVFGFVKLPTGSKPSVVSEILATAGTRLADYKVPESFYVINELRRNVLAKLDRHALMTTGPKTGGPRFGDATLQPKQSGENTLRAKHITAPTHFIEVKGVRCAYRRFGSYSIYSDVQRGGCADHNPRERRSGLHGNSAIAAGRIVSPSLLQPQS